MLIDGYRRSVLATRASTNLPELGERRRGPRSVVLGGLRVDLIQREQLVSAVGDALGGLRPPLLLASANLDHVYRFEHDPELFDDHDDGQWLVLLDGMPLVWACRRKTGRPWDKLAGSEILPDLLAVAQQTGSTVGFLGGTEELRRPLAEAVARGWPHLRVSGHWTPPRAVVEDPLASAIVAREIGAAGTDLLIVGLGKPRQERWMARHAATTGAKVVGAFGASADYLAGTQKRAPRFLSRIGAEWLYRLAQEPRRLARRYLAEGPVALARVARDTRTDA